MSMLQNFIFTTCQRHTTGTGASSARNACFSLPFSPQGEFSICLLETNLALTIWTAQSDQTILLKTTQQVLIAYSVLRLTCLNLQHANDAEMGGEQTEVQDRLEGTWWWSRERDEEANSMDHCEQRLPNQEIEPQLLQSRALLEEGCMKENTAEVSVFCFGVLGLEILRSGGSNKEVVSEHWEARLFFFFIMWVWQELSDHPLKYHSKCWILSAHLRQKYSFHCLI